MGYTQLSFAEECEISISSLKKYMKNELPYSISHLELFSDLLDCSTDYLLGKSETPRKEIQTLKEQTHLSDAALLALQLNISDYEKEPETSYDKVRQAVAEDDLIVASLVLEDIEFLGLIKSYLFFDSKDEYFNGIFNFVEIGGVILRPPDAQEIYLTKIMSRLVLMKDSFSKLENKQDVLTREVSEWRETLKGMAR